MLRCITLNAYHLGVVGIANYDNVPVFIGSSRRKPLNSCHERTSGVDNLRRFFLAFLLVLSFGLVPLLSKQITQLAQELPKMIAEGQHLLQILPERYPQFISVEQTAEVAASMPRTEGTA